MGNNEQREEAWEICVEKIHVAKEAYDKAIAQAKKDYEETVKLLTGEE